jgi:hypothetical protein
VQFLLPAPQCSEVVPKQADIPGQRFETQPVAAQHGSALNDFCDHVINA